jgi:phage/plasmid-associated DNA primase
MDSHLNNLLRKTGNEVMDQTSASIISHYGPKGNWVIKTTHLMEFWTEYCEIASEIDGPVGITLSEKTFGNAPIVLHCRLRFHKDEEVDYFDGDHCFYSDNFLACFVQQCQITMEEIYNLEKNNFEHIVCVLCSENHWIEGDVVITEFRIHFPYCKTSTISQLRLYRPKLIENLIKSNIMQYLVEPTIDSWDKIIDQNIPLNYIPMYRATTSNTQKKLKLEYIWGKLTDNFETPKNNGMDDLMNSMYEHTYIKKGVLNASIFNLDVDSEYWIPLLLSSQFWITISTEKVNKIDTNNIFTFQSPAGFTSPTSNEIGDETDLEIAERLLPILKQERVDKDNFWLDIGKALYNCDNGGENGLKTWIQFTERSETKTAEMCRNRYYSFNDTAIDIETIAIYAREDNKKDYNHWHQQWCMKAFDRATTCLHHDVAQALKRYYWLDYVCGNVNNTSWYKFRGHRYVKLDSGIELRRSLSKEFLHQFEIIRSNITKEIADMGENKEKDLKEAQVKKLTNLIAKLKTVGFKESIMREARELFYKEKFMTYLDSNPNLFGMLNCVIETYENKICVRPGKPQDYITMCTNINYRFDYNWETPEVVKLLKWFRQTFPDHELYEYILKDFSGFLRGRNSMKLFRIWTGSGNNSKSMIVKLLENAFGSYLIKMPTTLITTQRTGSSNATPELARSKGTHVAIIQEPDDDETMRKGIIKEFTGGDSFYARTLHDVGGDIQAMFNLILMCNKIPAIVNGDQATQNRIRIVPFLSKWSNEAPDDEEEQFKTRHFKKDDFFEEQIPSLAPALIWVLVYYFSKFIKDGLKQPDIVKFETDKYWNEHDCYSLYIEQCLVPVFKNAEKTQKDENACVTWAETYSSYKMWFRESYPGVKIVNTQVAKDNFIRRLGPQKNRRWYGIAFREEDNGGFANLD